LRERRGRSEREDDDQGAHEGLLERP
jgi:hypothetical protein